MHREGCGRDAGVLKKSVESVNWRMMAPLNALCTDRSKLIFEKMSFSGVMGDLLACLKAFRLLSCAE